MEGCKKFGVPWCSRVRSRQSRHAFLSWSRNPVRTGACEIYTHDIGDYLLAKEKLTLSRFKESHGPTPRKENGSRIQPNNMPRLEYQRGPRI